MPEKTVEAWLESPPERDDLVIELYVIGGNGFAQIFRENDRYWIDINTVPGTAPIRFDATELAEVITSATKTLKDSQRQGTVENQP